MCNFEDELGGKAIHPRGDIADIAQENSCKRSGPGSRRKGQRPATSSSEIPGATARRLAAPASPKPAKESITPHTVPNNPMNGETDAMVASDDIPFSSRRTSSPAAICISTPTPHPDFSVCRDLRRRDLDSLDADCRYSSALRVRDSRLDRRSLEEFRPRSPVACSAKARPPPARKI